MTSYVFDNAGLQTGRRFASLEELYDPGTIRHLDARGVDTGWRCLEVGGGGGSIAAWLASRVGSAGRVVVTDIDPRFITALASRGLANVEVQRHDIINDPLPEGMFDLVHTRLVLSHLPGRDAAMDKMVAALKPGGWLVIEDFDNLLADQSPTGSPSAVALYRKVREAQRTVMTRHGVDHAYARTLYHQLIARGLAAVGIEGSVTLYPAGSPGVELIRANIEQVRAEAISAGLMEEREVDDVLQLLDDPAFSTISGVMMTAWGQRRVTLT